MAILQDESLKDLYWPQNVTKILRKYDLPGAKFILECEPVTKSAFKRFLRNRVMEHHVNISEGRLMKSNLYRFIYQGDFSFNRKIQHPMIQAATTRRQTLGLKLMIMHLTMEYPNNENMNRIGLRKSKNCAICEESGITVIDSTEHTEILNLSARFCRCLIVRQTCTLEQIVLSRVYHCDS